MSKFAFSDAIDQADPDASPSADGPLALELLVSDADCVAALLEYPPGEPRDDFALAALKIGLVALRYAGGRVDGELIRRETARLLEGMQSRLGQHAEKIQHDLSRELKDYFDPEGGRFEERIKRLIQRDGDLEQVLSRHIGGEDSQLAKTLVAHIGQNSPLMKLLSPDETQGLLAALRATVESQLGQQRERLLKEFSLDNQEGALARLVAELARSHGVLAENLQEKIDEVVKEFSLDEDNSALSRLVRNVDAAQRTIRSEFSLDNPESAFSRMNVMLHDTKQAVHQSLTLDEEQSPLSRLKRELLEILTTHAKGNQEFQEQVKVALGKMVARREEAERSTRHGLAFEDAVYEFVSREAQHVGDVAEPTGARTGRIKNCKVGDCVIELGPDSAAPGAKVVIEAKQDAAFTLAKAREEIETARKNRDAQIGLFVFSAKSAPPGAQPLVRYGDDVFVVWDAEDPNTDWKLRSGLVTTRALCIRGGRQLESQAADLKAIDEAILEIEKHSQNLDEVRKSGETIRSASEKILDRVRISRERIEKQIEVLRMSMETLKGSLDVGESSGV
jgi:hypothetical protein